jgi:hypothetical protein
MSIFDRCTDIINNFQGEKELASALLDFLAILAIPQIQIFTFIDENIKDYLVIQKQNIERNL